MGLVDFGQVEPHYGTLALSVKVTSCVTKASCVLLHVHLCIYTPEQILIIYHSFFLCAGQKIVYMQIIIYSQVFCLV